SRSMLSRFRATTPNTSTPMTKTAIVTGRRTANSEICTRVAPYRFIRPCEKSKVADAGAGQLPDVALRQAAFDAHVLEQAAQRKTPGRGEKAKLGSQRGLVMHEKCVQWLRRRLGPSQNEEHGHIVDDFHAAQLDVVVLRVREGQPPIDFRHEVLLGRQSV